MVNANDILKNVMNNKRVKLTVLPFKISINEADFNELSEKLGADVLKECFENVIRESCNELIISIRKQTINVPIKEVIRHEVRGEFKFNDDDDNKTHTAIIREKILNFLKLNPDKRFKHNDLMTMLDLDKNTEYGICTNVLNVLSSKGIIKKEYNDPSNRIAFYYLPSVNNDLNNMFEPGQKTSVFGGFS